MSWAKSINQWGTAESWMPLTVSAAPKKNRRQEIVVL